MIASEQPVLPKLPSGRWFAFIMLTAIAVIMILCNVSCDCNYHLTKAKKKCGITALTDTTFIQDTTITKLVTKDTLFYYKQHDTVIVREGKLVMKYYYHNDTTYLDGACLPDTIYKDRPYIVNNTELSPDTTTWKDWVTWGVLLFVLVMGFWKR